MAENIEISEKEFAVIREISKNHLPDQRTISQRTGISLGLTNLIIKRLIKKGYIKAKQLNQKKIQYLLTPKSITEQANKTYNFTLQTINNLRLIKGSIHNMIKSLHDEGYDVFEIRGNDEIADITELAFRTLTYGYTKTAAEGNALLVATMSGTKQSKIVDLLDHLINKSLI